MSKKQFVIVGGLAGLGYLLWQATQGNVYVTAPASLDSSGNDSGGGLVPSNMDTSSIEGYLQSQGLTPSQASGVAAGIYAESLSNPNAINPTSGAYGVGQWLGSRKTALFAQYGSSPTLQQQLDFLISELHGGDSGGSAVLSQSDPLATLTAYITKFMRPAKGIETTSDIARGTAYLG